MLRIKNNDLTEVKVINHCRALLPNPREWHTSVYVVEFCILEAPSFSFIESPANVSVPIRKAFFKTVIDGNDTILWEFDRFDRELFE